MKLFEKDPTRQVATYVEAVKTVDPMKAAGKPHTLWVAFAKMYEKHNRLDSAEEIFKKATQVNYKAVDHLASIWCEWAEMELRHSNFDKAIELMRQATAEPSVEVKRRGIYIYIYLPSYFLLCVLLFIFSNSNAICPVQLLLRGMNLSN